MTDVRLHNESQRRYFEQTAKKRMVPRRSAYLERHVDELVRFADLTHEDDTLEIGAGMGRYTIPLLERGYRVEALDLSPVLLARLAEYNAGRPRPGLHAADIADPPAELEGRFDAAIGFFTLHHLHDLGACFGGIRRVLRPGGRVVFLEPNPLNPLYYVQMLITPGMTWEGDGGIVRMRPKTVFDALAASGFERCRLSSFGFFPPFIAESKVGLYMSSPRWTGMASRARMPKPRQARARFRFMVVSVGVVRRSGCARIS